MNFEGLLNYGWDEYLMDSVEAYMADDEAEENNPFEDLECV